MSIPKEEQEGLVNPLNKRAPKKACDARNQNLILGTFRKTNPSIPGCGILEQNLIS